MLLGLICGYFLLEWFFPPAALEAGGLLVVFCVLWTFGGG